MRRANVYFKPQCFSNGQGERMAQSTGLYLARSLRTLVGSDTHTYTQTLSMTLLSAELFTSEEASTIKSLSPFTVYWSSLWNIGVINPLLWLLSASNLGKSSHNF